MTIAKKIVLYDQAQVAYDPAAVGAPDAQLCANCRWFCPPGEMEEGGTASCHLVSSYPLAIQPTGWCNEWAALPSMEPEPLEVVIVDATESETITEDVPEVEMQMSMGSHKATFIGRIVNAAKLMRFINPKEIAKPVGFKALGNGYWFAPFTNNFEDRDKEIISQAAHKRYVGRVQSGLVDLPELWIHHIPGTRHGKALYVGMTDHTVFAVGKFDDTPLGKLMEKTYLSMKPGDLAMSHGFRYPVWAKQNNVYNDYNSFEVTVLRPQVAANPYTPFQALENDKELRAMPLDDKQKQSILSTFGDKTGANILGLVDKVEVGEQQVKELLGARYKDYADVTDASKAKGEAPETLDAMKSLIPALFAGHGDVIDLVTRMDKKLTAQDEKLATLTKQLDAANKALALKPTPASQADSTLVPEGETKDAKKELDQKQNGKGFDPAFPGMNITAAG